MNLKPNDINIRSILNSYPSLRIPNFQREYSWDKRYYNSFLEDIMKRIKVKSDKIENDDYFIGTMVFAGDIEKDNEVDVVDGQQRLTVITILLSVITNHLKTIGEEEFAKVTFEYVKSVDDYNKFVPKLKTVTSYPYFESFVQSIDKSVLTEPTSLEEESIKETYDFYNKELQENSLRKKYNFPSSISYVDILLKVRDQILSLKVISIITNNKETAYEIFEILNAKGKSLASIDLIKNIIYEKFHGDENSKDKVVENSWENIKRILRQRNLNIGIVTFYRHFWISKYKKVTNAQLYDSFKELIKPKDKNRYEEFILELEKESKNYIKVVSPSLDDYKNRKEYNWLIESLRTIENYFGVVQARVFFLALFNIKDKDLISNQEFKKSINYIENFIFAYTSIMKKQANIYEARFSKLAINLRKSKTKSETNDILKKYLYEAFSSLFPSEQEFVEKFVNLQFSKKDMGSNVIAKYAVNKISSYYENRDVIWDDSSIEHIINENIDDRNTLMIGNLIALEESLNNEASNLSFEEKIEIYSKSKYCQVKEFVNITKEFKIENIRKRSEMLAKYYYSKIKL